MDLKKLYGRRYKVQTEEGSEKGDPASYIVPCDHGHIYQHGPDVLGAATYTAGKISSKLKRLPCVTVRQDGGGVNVTFNPRDFDLVAEIMKPCSRRQLSPEHKAKLVEAGKQSRFASGSKPDSKGLEREVVAMVELEHGTADHSPVLGV